MIVAQPNSEGAVCCTLEGFFDYDAVVSDLSHSVGNRRLFRPDLLFVLEVASGDSWSWLGCILKVIDVIGGLADDRQWDPLVGFARQSTSRIDNANPFLLLESWLTDHSIHRRRSRRW